MRGCANTVLFIIIALGLLLWPALLREPPGWIGLAAVVLWIPLCVAWIMLRTLAYGLPLRGAARALEGARRGHRWEANVPCPFVEGTFEGVPARLAVHGDADELRVELRPAGPRSPSFRLERRRGGADLTYAAPGLGAASFVQASEVEREVATLFDLGFEWVEAAPDRLAAGAGLLLAGPLTRDARPAALVGALGALRRLARHAEARELDGQRALLGWTDGGSRALCPYCRDDLLADGAPLAPCPRCRTAHHQACYEEAGGCTVFACGPARAVGRRTKDAS